MRKHFITFTILLFAFAINSCKKHESLITPNPIVPYDAGTAITTAVAGKVTAQDGTALNGVAITIGSSTTITDVGGNFIIPKAIINQKAGFIKATKDGYFAGSRTIIAKEKVINNIVIQLVKKTATGSFVNATGGTITVATGGSIVFPANAVVLKNGGAYTGTVKVAAYFLDPTSKTCFKEMPGDLRGINTANNEQVLTSYGMMAVELQGSNGEALQMATGKAATLTMPINASIQSNAPATIPLWYFDETKAMWIEQGKATKTGNNYVGSVSHFTWWNCDWGGGPLELTAKFVDQNGNPLSNYHVYYVTNAGWGGGGGHGNTESDGSLTGMIPANTPIIIKVEHHALCAITPFIYTNTVGPFTQNTDLGTIIVTIPNFATTSITINGTIKNCNNNLVNYGWAMVNINNSRHYCQITNGVLNFTKIFCSNVSATTATIDVFDLATSNTNATPITVNITGAGTYNIGQVAACYVPTLVKYTATVFDQNGNHINTGLNTFFVFNDSIQSGIQNDTVVGIIPVNKIVTIKVYTTLSCSPTAIQIGSFQVGPFSNDFNAGAINVTIPQSLILTISGTATDCNNSPVTNGSATLYVNGQVYTSSIANGVFAQQIPKCTQATVAAVLNIVDNNNQQQNVTIVNLNVSNADVSVGTVKACGLSTNEYFTFKLDSTNYTNNTLTAYKNGINTYIAGSITGTSDVFQANFQGTSVGAFSFYANFTVNGISYNGTYYVTVTEYGELGQYVSGSFNGTTKDMKTLTGSFRIKRTQ